MNSAVKKWEELSP
jgi:hypothetical protein